MKKMKIKKRKKKKKMGLPVDYPFRNLQKNKYTQEISELNNIKLDNEKKINELKENIN